jgi:hypothetical protein
MKGTVKRVVDALSHRPCIFSVIHLQTNMRENILTMQMDDDWYKEVKENIGQDTIMVQSFEGYTLDNDGLMRYNDPKRIQRRLRTTQNSQKKLMNLKMASEDREREKIQSPQNSMKMELSQSTRCKISNSINNSSNIVTDRKIFMVKFWPT